MEIKSLQRQTSADGGRSSFFLSLGRNVWLVFLLIAAIHAALAIYYKEISGLDILANPQKRVWDWWWQTVPVDLLVNDLWRSLWYLHTQPPLYNLYGALFFNLFSSNPMEAMQFANIILGSLIAGMVYMILLLTTRRWRLSFVAGLFLALDPGLFLFEAYILYDLLTVFGVIASVCTFAWYLHTRQVRYAVLYILVLSMLVMTCTVYHLIIIPIGLGVAMLSIPQNFKKVLLAGLTISLLPIGWYAKNDVLFGFFGASSWTGFGLWKVVSQSYTPEQLAQLADEGLVAPVAAEVEIFRPASKYFPYGFNQKSDIPVLSRDDQRNINQIKISQVYQDSALRLIAKNPGLLIQSVLYSFKIFNIPSAQFKHHVPNAQRINRHVYIFSELLQGRILENYLHYPIGSIFFFIVPFCALSFTALFAYKTIWRRINPFALIQEYPLETWIVFLIVYTTLISVLFEVGENNRQKFYIEQLVLVYLVALASRAFPVIIHRLKFIFGWERAPGHLPQAELT